MKVCCFRADIHHVHQSCAVIRSDDFEAERCFNTEICLVNRAPATSSAPDVEICLVSHHLGNDAAAILPEVALSSVIFGNAWLRNPGWKNHKFPGICQSGWDWHICGFLAKTCNLRPKKHGKTHILSTPKQTARPYPSCFQQPKMELPIPKGSLHEAPRRVINSFTSCGRIGALT